jgi:hypothetical protein
LQQKCSQDDATSSSLKIPVLPSFEPRCGPQTRSIYGPNEDRSYRRLPIAEDPLQLSSHQRMEEIAKWPERQPVVHHVLDDCRLPCVVEAMGVSPKAIRT